MGAVLKAIIGFCIVGIIAVVAIVALDNSEGMPSSTVSTPTTSVPESGAAPSQTSYSGPILSEATMCLAVDSLRRPIGPTSTFFTDTPEIFCSVKLSNALGEVEVLGEWVYVQGEVVGVHNHVFDRYSFLASGTRYVFLAMGNSGKPWNIGEYKLVLYLDGQPQVTRSFSIVAGTQSGESSTKQESPTRAECLESQMRILKVLPEVKEQVDLTLDYCTQAILYGNSQQRSNGFDVLNHDFTIYTQVIGQTKDEWHSLLNSVSDCPLELRESWSCYDIALIYQYNAYDFMRLTGRSQDVELFRHGLDLCSEAHSRIAECAQQAASAMS